MKKKFCLGFGLFVLLFLVVNGDCKQKMKRNKNTFLYEKWNNTSRPLLGTKFNFTEWEKVTFSPECILAESWARLNLFISDFTYYKHMSFKKRGVTKQKKIAPLGKSLTIDGTSVSLNSCDALKRDWKELYSTYKS